MTLGAGGPVEHPIWFDRIAPGLYYKKAVLDAETYRAVANLNCPLVQRQDS